MKQLFYLLAIGMLTACGQQNSNLTSNTVNDKPIKVLSDTLIAGDYILHFEQTDSFTTKDIFGDMAYRTKLTDTIGNWHDRAAKIESYLQNKFGDFFYTTDSTLVLKLANGTTETFAKWDKEKDEGFNFEHYFDKIGYYLLRVQWGEGNCWMLVNQHNGWKKYINGLPYIANDSKKIVTINADLEAGYNFNGIELYTIGVDSLQTEFSKETIWAPSGLRWLNENQFLLKREHYHVDSITGEQNNTIDYRRITLTKKAGLQQKNMSLQVSDR